MSNIILVKESLIPDQTSKMVISAPQIAKKAKPGNFLMLHLNEHGERFPLTIADADAKNGTITIVYMVAGKSTALLETYQEGDKILDICGPLGKATHIEKKGTVICIGGGTGIAAMHHIAKGHHLIGNKVISIIGARGKDWLIFENELAKISDELIICTDDGSYKHKGLVTGPLFDLLSQDNNIFEVVAVGPVPMMDAVSQVTKPFNIPTIVSLNSIMVDGIGMCGACRVTVGGETKFSCVDGPEFDGHQVDFLELRRRLISFSSQEKISFDQHKCKCQENTHKKHLLPRTEMPCLPPEIRKHNFEEVSIGYTYEMAMTEASRCIQCKNPRCVSGCPVEVPIPEFIAAITNGEMENAYEIIKRTNSLPAVCGRVCPQEHQCEGKCILGVKGEPVAIGRLERFVADTHIAHNARSQMSKPKPSAIPREDLKVACLGSGPASLTVAGYLANFGIKVDVYEALHEPGGVLTYGIPSFRLPKSVVATEINDLRQSGVNFMMNWVGGRTITVQDLFEEGYKSVFIGVGAGLPRFLNIPGENLIGVFSANEYLTRANLGRAYRFPSEDMPTYYGKNVAVFGAGNVAMDAARTAIRLGAENVFIVYRRTKAEMPARTEEIHHAEEEGVQFKLLVSPICFNGDDGFSLKSVTLQRMKLGEPDSTGRSRPEPIKNDFFDLPIDLAIIALGTRANPILLEATDGLDLDKEGHVLTNEETGETSLPNTFAGGDIVTGSATVILAMGAGRKAAQEICKRLLG